jgi:ABC-2 type transport system permease protein
MSLPTVAVTTLIALNVIPATLGIAVGFGAALLVLVLVGWRVASVIFDPERLITNTK